MACMHFSICLQEVQSSASMCAASCRQADSKAIARIVRELAAVHSSDTTRILLEIPQPNSMNGKQSWYQTGFSYGVWHGALASHGFEVCAPLDALNHRSIIDNMHANPGILTSSSNDEGQSWALRIVPAMAGGDGFVQAMEE